MNESNYLRMIYEKYSSSTFDGQLAKYIVDNYFFDEGCILDIGCGTGKYIQEFTNLGYVTVGIDRDNCNFEEEINIDDNVCDYIFCKSIIEHISNTDKFLSEIYRILKPGGKVIFLTPSWEYNYKWFYDDYTHIKPFHRKGLQDALKINNFKWVEVDYLYYLPFVWKYPILKIIPKIINLFTRDKARWKNKEETISNVLIRFSKEVQLIGVAEK
jgi:SAM-dependent methyltransferase